MAMPHVPQDDRFSPSAPPSVRTQAALVRALADELGRYSPTDPRATALRAQIEEEEARLASFRAS